MPSSDPDGISGDRWALSLHRIRIRGAPVRLTGGKPQWYAMIYSLGIFSLSRSLLAVAGPVDITVTIGTHAGSCALGVAFGRYISKSDGERVPRIWSGAIGLVGCGLAVISPEFIPVISPEPSPETGAAYGEDPGAADIWTRLVIPLTTLTLMLVAHLLGEAMVTWFPHGTPASPPAPADPRLRRRWITSFRRVIIEIRSKPISKRISKRMGKRTARRDPRVGPPE